jgi:phosphate/sulfate permease
VNFNYFSALAAGGLFIVILWIVVAVVGFVISAFLASLYVRLIIRFMRKSLDREYRYMRGDYTRGGSNRVPNTVPRDW